MHAVSTRMFTPVDADVHTGVLQRVGCSLLERIRVDTLIVDTTVSRWAEEAAGFDNQCDDALTTLWRVADGRA